ncbi:MAG: amidohydrolase 2 [Conexibacter sp.]|nr:amidohydrolase 2 [Conexibacter sp.]
MTALAPVDAGLVRWYERERAALGTDSRPAEVLDAHTHVGQNDPDTMRCSPAQLLEMVDEAAARAVVFPLHEPNGYRGPNADVLAAAAASAGRLVAFARLDPRDDPLAEAQRGLAAGARGFKLHPRAEQFPLDTPALEQVWALADEQRLPVLVHAGRGIPALGAHAVDLCARHPGVRMILAHAGISDLAWIGARAQELPNLYFDTAWWSPADLLTLFATVPPGQILYASDAPYGRIPSGALSTLRIARQSGLDDEQIRLVLGGQTRRLIEGEEPLDAGPVRADGVTLAVDALLDRVATFLIGGLAQVFRQVSGDEMLALARLACAVPEGAQQAPHCRAILELLDARERLLARVPQAADPTPFVPGMYLLLLALNIARTPAVPVPDALDLA